MNRNAIAALAAAAVVGIAGGTAAAVMNSRDHTGVPTTAGSPRPSPGPASAGASDILYAAPGKIHDGDKIVSFRQPRGTMDQLVRVRDGYVIGVQKSVEEPTATLVHVSPDGHTNRIADVRGFWDLDQGGTRIVGIPFPSGPITVWDTAGKALARWRSFSTDTKVVFSGAQVLASVATPSGRAGMYRLIRWNPDTGVARRLQQSGMANLAASVDGHQLLGYVDPQGNPNSEQALCSGMIPSPIFSRDDGSHSFTTCDWRANDPIINPFSPDGSKVLMVPAMTDGFGPGSFATFSAQTGPIRDLRTFRTPERTLSGSWSGNRHILLVGSTTGSLEPDDGSWIKRCTLTGSCTEIARLEHGTMVLGQVS